MKLQTQIPLQKEKNTIDYYSQLLLLGSCFVENIGSKLDYYKFQSVQNPFGILFHPKAIEALVVNAVNKKQYTESDVFFLNERWHCFDAHSSLSDSSKEKLLLKLNKNIALTHQQIEKATHTLITLGTSWFYKHAESNSIVANCHKVSQKQFVKKLMSVDEIATSLQTIITKIQSVNKNVNFVFTISPVRHLKDGFVQNQQSKAHLITAVHELVKHTNISYFPSYEIMMDELRDYRFYASDMMHPAQLAIDYIWEKFSGVWLADEILPVMKQVAVIQKRLIHKPFNPTSKAHQQFLIKLKAEILDLQTLYSFMEFNAKNKM